VKSDVLPTNLILTGQNWFCFPRFLSFWDARKLYSYF